MSCGVDPREAWDYTPFELLEAIRGYRERQTDRAYLSYNLAQCIAAMCFAKRRPEPCQAFPGLIEYKPMTDEEIWSALLGWADAMEAYDGCERED